jgi:hypothetical protein
VWNHQTHLCQSSCEAIHQYRQLKYVEGGSYTWWHAVHCTFTGCLPEDYEQDAIARMVDLQGIYQQDGLLRPDYVAEQLIGGCWETVAAPSTDCTTDTINAAANSTHYFADLAQEMAAYFANRPGGIRQQLTPEQEAARVRLQEIAERACSETPRAPGELAQTWGTRAHARFNQLVETEGAANPRLFPETGYLKGRVAEGGGHVKDAKYPDAVYGNDLLHPEVLFDLKTGLKLIEPGWLRLLTPNLPLGFQNVPVFMLHC